jgi:pyridoxine 5'-phosphate synthase PdxJ
MIAALLAPGSAFADAEQARVQFCWAMGKFDHTIYYAEIENREDRQASFDELLQISGIDHHAVKCGNSDSTSHRLARAKLFKNWLESEFEIVNTTFLSDLDY